MLRITVNPTNNSGLILDTGANINVISNPTWFSTIEGEEENLTISGTAKVTFVCEGKGFLKFPLNEIFAYYIPEFNCNIISEYKLRDFFTITYINNDDIRRDVVQALHKTKSIDIIFSRNEENLFSTDCLNKYRISMTIAEIKSTFNKEQIKFMYRIHELHRRTGFVGLDKLKLMIKNNVIFGAYDLGTITVQDVKNYQDSLHRSICKGCILGKFQNEDASTLDNVEVAHTSNTAHIDIMHIIYGRDRKRLNYIISKDRFTGFLITIQISTLGTEDIQNGLINIANIYKQYGHSLQNAHLDHASTFKAIKQELINLSVSPKFHSPERHVRRAENAIKEIKKSFRTILLDMSFRCPYALYPYIIQWVTECSNMSLKSHNDYKTPWTQFTGMDVSYHNNFRASFGDIVAIPSNAINPTTDASRATIAIVIGREESMRGGLLVKDLNTLQNKVRHQIQKIRINDLIVKQIKTIGQADMNNIFHDKDEDANNTLIELLTDLDEIDNSSNTFQTARTNDKVVSDINQENENPMQEENEDVSFNDYDNNTVYIDNNIEENEIIELESNNSFSEDDNIINDYESENDSDIISLDLNEDQDKLNETQNQMQREEIAIRDEFKSLRRSNRSACPNPKYFEFHPSLKDNKQTKKSREKLIIRAAMIDSDLKIRDAIKKFGLEVTTKSVNDEINQLIEKDVWTCIKPNIRVFEKILPTKFFLKEKYDANNVFEKLKSRLVACGNFEESTSEDVAAPTVSLNTVYLYLAVAAKKEMKIKIFDIGGAYLNAELAETESKFIRINSDVVQLIQDEKMKSCIRQNGEIIAQLKKCLYGLKISGKKWYETISRFICIECKFTRSIYDPCSFHKFENDKLALILLYVDDILIAAEDDSIIEKVKIDLTKEFKKVTEKNGNELSFLRMAISINTDGIKINQAGYIDEKFESGQIESPHTHNFDIRNFDNESANSAEIEKEFNTKLMQLMYIAIRTRPDILYNITAFSTLKRANVEALGALKRIENYLHSTKELSLTFKSGECDIKIYADASFDSHSDSRSHIGFCIFIDKDSSPILVKSNKMNMVVNSVSDAELLALSEAVKHGKLIQEQLKELGIIANMTLYEDNKSAISIVSNRNISFSAKTKLMKRNFLFVTEFIERNELKIEYVPSEEQIADLLTKAVKGNQFYILRDVMLKR